MHSTKTKFTVYQKLYYPGSICFITLVRFKLRKVSLDQVCELNENMKGEYAMQKIHAIGTAASSSSALSVLGTVARASGGASRNDSSGASRNDSSGASRNDSSGKPYDSGGASRNDSGGASQ